LQNPVTVVEAGASFAGGGSLINSAGRRLRLLDGANVNVIMKNQGILELGASPGQVQGLDFQQDPTGVLEIDLAGVGLDDFDRMTLLGQAMLAGELKVSLLNSFSPAAGNAFTFLSAVGGISSAFNTTTFLILPAGLSWLLRYNSTSVQLSVIPALPGDFNGDGSVDAADYVVWRNIDGTQSAYDVWRAHFGQTTGAGMDLPSAAPLAANVPEPTTIAQLTAMLAGVVFSVAGRNLNKRSARALVRGSFRN